MSASDQDRRRHRRFVLSLPAAIVHGGAPSRGRLVDLSEQGASLTAPAPVDAGTPAYLHFDLVPDIRCEATGAVVRVVPFDRLFGIAVELVYANPAYLHFLRNLDATPDPIRPVLLGDIRDLTLRFG
jgi:hypothetical protein